MPDMERPCKSRVTAAVGFGRLMRPGSRGDLVVM